MILEDPTPATLDNLEGTIARRDAKHNIKLALLVTTENEMKIIGHIEPNLAEAWNVVASERTFTARSLADRLNLAISTASTRLLKLYKNRLLARDEEVTSSGRQHIYQVPA